MIATHSSKRHLIIVALLALLLVISTVLMIFTKTLYDKNFPRYDEPKYTGYLRFSDIPGYDRTVVKFKSGKNTLTGYVYDEVNKKGLVVIAPGRGQSAEKYLAQTLYFVDHGWRVFSFDYTGSYASEGTGSIGLHQSRVDLEAALTYIKNSDPLKDLPMVLFGHSWGGYAVAAVLGDHQDITAVASASGFNSPMGLAAEYLEGQIGAFAHVEYPFLWIYQSILLGKNARMTAVDGINSGDTPVMIIHDSADEAISYNGASIIAQRKQITNPNAVYVTRNTANGSGHMDLFRSEAAIRYINQLNKEFKVLYDRYQGAIPDNIMAEFYAGVNRFQTSELDVNFMNEINSFFESALPG